MSVTVTLQHGVPEVARASASADALVVSTVAHSNFHRYRPVAGSATLSPAEQGASTAGAPATETEAAVRPASPL